MATCNICKYAGTPSYKSPCSECKGFSKYEYEKPKTNADRIRAMNDEELAELLQDAYNAGSDDAEAWHFGKGHRYSFEWDLEWLQSPAKKEGE